MGAVATRSIRARRREVAARVDRLVVGQDLRDPEARARRQRVLLAQREARRGVRRIVRLEAQLSVAQVQVGTALVRLVAEGVSVDRAVAAVGLSRSVGRRYLRGAVNPSNPRESRLSTSAEGGRAPGEPSGDGEAGTTKTAVASSEGVG